jgi:hypothetical protein
MNHGLIHSLSKEALHDKIIADCTDCMKVEFWFETLYQRFEKGTLTQQQIYLMLTSQEVVLPQNHL